MGAILLSGFNSALEATNQVGFCVSCHEMQQVQAEYKKSVHYSNRTGVRVTCSDCHVPRSGLPKLVRKVRAANDVYHWVLGTVDTEAKFETKRLELAETVWAYMKESGLRECRSCHAFQAMDFERQGRRPRQTHPEAMTAGKTCIDCHKGIAHKLPKDFEHDD